MNNQPEKVGNKLLRYFMMAVGISIGTVVVKNCNKERAVDTWGEIATEMRSGSDSLFEDDSSRIMFSNCLVDKFKRKYPNGPNNIGQDSINSNAVTFGAECGLELKGKAHFKISWSSEYASKFKEYLIKTSMVSKIPDNLKSTFCDCFLQKMKVRYPNGIREQIPKSVSDSVYLTCKIEIVN